MDFGRIKDTKNKLNCIYTGLNVKKGQKILKAKKALIFGKVRRGRENLNVPSTNR